jgi:N utilization substance protein B
MQILYSYYKSEGRSLEDANKELLHSINKSYEQYLLFLQIALEVTSHATSIVEKKRNKRLPSPEDLNPNTRFIDNKFVAQLETSSHFLKKLEDVPVSWANNKEFIPKFYRLIVESSIYDEYMNDEDTGYEADKKIWVRIFKLVIYRSAELGDLLEDMSIYWNDDADLVLGMVQKTIKAFEESNGENQDIMTLFKDKEDEEFAPKLLSKAILSGDDFKERIEKKTLHWEADRIAFVDKLLMQIALAEVVDFPAIPIKVSINEYLDIAKSYSTLKSATFINGVLDSIIKDLKKDKAFTKVGRGLME